MKLELELTEELGEELRKIAGNRRVFVEDVAIWVLSSYIAKQKDSSINLLQILNIVQAVTQKALETLSQQTKASGDSGH